MAEPSPSREIEALIHGYVEGTLTPEECVRLREFLEINPRQVSVILRHLQMDRMIRDTLKLAENEGRLAHLPETSQEDEGISTRSPQRDGDAVPRRRATYPRRERKSMSWLPWAIAAGVVVAITLLLLNATQRSRPSSNDPSSEKIARPADRQSTPHDESRQSPRVRETVNKPPNEQDPRRPVTPQTPPDPQSEPPKVVIHPPGPPPVKEPPEAPVKPPEVVQHPIPSPREPPTESRTPVATVEIAEGKLTAGGRALAKGDEIHAGSLIETNGRGRSKLVLNDRSEIYLNSGTTIALEPGEPGPAWMLEQGEMFGRFVKQERPFVVKTACGDVVVTGTELDVRVIGTKATVSVISGTVECVVEQERKEVGAYRQTTMVKGQSPSEPQPIEAAKITAWMKGLQPELLISRAELFRGKALDEKLWRKNDPRGILSVNNGLLGQCAKAGEKGDAGIVGRFCLTGDIDVQMEFMSDSGSNSHPHHVVTLSLRDGLSDRAGRFSAAGIAAGDPQGFYYALWTPASDAARDVLDTVDRALGGTDLHRVPGDQRKGTLRITRTGTLFKGYFLDPAGTWQELSSKDVGKANPLWLAVDVTLRIAPAKIRIHNIKIIQGEFVWKEDR